MASSPADRSPRGLPALAAVAAAFLILPLVALAAKAPWPVAWQALTAPETLDALRLSAVTTILATALAVTLGVPLAFVYARTDFAGRELLRSLTVMPMVLPPVVGGIALLLAYGRRGLIGAPLQALGLTIPFTTGAVVLAEAFVAMPFLVVTVEAALRSLDRQYEEAARTLGAGPWRTFWRVTLPLVAPAVGAGATLAWARALGEFGATITFAGNLPGTTQTAPLAVYLLLETRPDESFTLSVLMLAVSLAVLVALRRRWLGQI
jgi:molybdate transport system permease protein